MDRYRNFVSDPAAYPTAELAAFIQGLHAADQHWCAQKAGWRGAWTTSLGPR
jgi:hypothetical protein